MPKRHVGAALRTGRAGGAACPSSKGGDAALRRVRIRSKQRPPAAYSGAGGEALAHARAGARARQAAGRKTGGKSGKSASAGASSGVETVVVNIDVEEPQQWQSTAAVGPFPGTPVDPRLEPAGAILHQEGTEEGRLQDSAYKVFIPWFENECDSELHPHPHLPGLGIDEVKLEGLKVWNTQHKDRGGAGWIAVCPVKKPGQTNYEEKWFNVDTWKSWRLSFLLARLQRKVWEVSWTFRPVDLNEDKLIEVDGEKITPDALRRMAHQVAQSLQPGGMPGGLGLLLKGDVGEEPDAL